MSLERAAARLADPGQARLVMWLCSVGGLGMLADFGFAEWRGTNTPWDHLGVPVLAGTTLAAALVARLRPAHVNGAMSLVLLAASVFALGAMHAAATTADAISADSLSASAQFMPLLYVVAFVTLRQGATWLCWAHYAAILSLYTWHVLRPGGPEALAATEHIWMAMLTAHPAYIVALHYISTLKGRLARSEHQRHAGQERFLAMLSHEIRSPLQAMIGSIDLLAIKARSEVEQRAVDRLRMASHQLDTHLRDVTEFARLENPNWQLRPAPHDVLALCQTLVDDLQTQARARRLGLRLTLEGPPSAWSTLQTDDRRLRQVLDNLLSNALKYTLHGEVRLHLAAPSEPGEPLTMAVIDTGIGISPERQAQVFQPYERVEDPRVAHVEGSGLGLTVVRLLCERLGLTLSLHSVPGEGTTVTLRWPA